MTCTKTPTSFFVVAPTSGPVRINSIEQKVKRNMVLVALTNLIIGTKTKARMA